MSNWLSGRSASSNALRRPSGRHGRPWPGTPERLPLPQERKALADGDALVDEELKEHAEAEQLLKTWEGMSGDDPEFMTTFQQIREGLLHHIDEEEEPKLFPQLQATLSREEQEDLGAKITRAKKLAPTRPHPSAPDSPPGDKILGIPTGLVDRIRDLMSGRSTG